MRLGVKNWAEFQHYKNRMPPWIKLYKTWLDDRRFQCLPDASRALAPCVWLLASESKDGTLNGEAEDIAFRVHQSVKWTEAALKPLISAGFLFQVRDDSDTLADGVHYASAETETETETEKPLAQAPIKKLTALGVDEQIARDWLAVRKAKRAPLTDTVIKELKLEAEKAGISVPEAVAICAKRSWQGFKASWDWRGDKPAGKNGAQSIPWWSSDATIIAKGKELHIEPRPGESIHEFKGRINVELGATS